MGVDCYGYFITSIMIIQSIDKFIKLRVLLFRGNMHWLAGCLEHDIIAQGKSVEHAKAGFIGLMHAWASIAETQNLKLFVYTTNGGMLPSPPKKLIEAHNDAKFDSEHIEVVTVRKKKHRLKIAFSITDKKIN